MISPRKTRAPKRRIDEIDDRIKCLTNVINKIKGCKRPYFDLKLMGVQLKKQKLISLTSFAQTQKMQTILAEMDFLVAENDLNVEIEAIKSCKKFRRSEEALKKREKRSREDIDSTQIIETISGHSTPKKRKKDRTSLSLAKSFPNIHDSEDKENNPPVNNKPSNKNPDTTDKTAFDYKKDALNQKIRIARVLFGINNKTNSDKDLNKDNDRKVADNASILHEKRISSSHLHNKKTEPTQKETKKAAVKKRAQPAHNNKNCTAEASNFEISRKMPTRQRGSTKVINTAKSNLPCKDINTDETGEEINLDTVETKGTHRNVINLYRTYKKIYSPEVFSANKIKLSYYEKAIVNKDNTDIANSKSLKVFENVSKGEEKTSKRLRTKHQTNEPSKTGKISSESDKISININNNTITSRRSKSDEVTVRKDTKKRERTVAKPIHMKSKDNIKGVDDERVISYMTDLVNKSCEEESLDMKQKLEESVLKVAMEKNDETQNDTLNSIIYDLLSKQVKIEKSPSDKTSTCYQCGSVEEGHMCAYTIRELLEQC